MVDMNRFCSEYTDTRYEMNEPFVIGGWKYATDGCILVRIRTQEPDTPAGPSHSFPPVKDLLKFMPVRSVLRAIPPTEADKHYVCPDCAVECPQCGFDSLPGCERCKDGFTYLPDCPTCGDRRTMPYMRYGQMYVAPMYHSLLSRLPRLEWLDVSVAAGNFLLAFQFDEGEGILAGVRYESIHDWRRKPQ